MNGKKKAVLRCGDTVDGGAGAFGASSSCPDYNTRRGPLSRALPTGAGNALPGRELQRLLGLRSLRDVSALVERARRAGVPVCASCDGHNPGYFLPATVDELERYLRSLRGRCREVARTLEGLESIRDAWTGQMRLEDQRGVNHG